MTQIPSSILQIYKSHNALSHISPFRTEMWIFLFLMMYCWIWDWCITGFVRLVYQSVVSLPQRIYITALRQMKRIDSIRRSPIFSNFHETLVGMTSIRAYRRQEQFILRNDRLTDDSQITYYPINIAERSAFNLCHQDRYTLGSFLSQVSFSFDMNRENWPMWHSIHRQLLLTSFNKLFSW